MKDFRGGKLGKTVIVEMERGEKLIEGLKNKLSELGIKNAVVVSAIGSLQKLCYHRPTSFGAAAEDEFITVEEPLEICSLVGTVINGEPHFHFSAAGPNGIYGGHLEVGTEVLYLVEITLTEIEGFNLQRKLTDENVKKLFEIE